MLTKFIYFGKTLINFLKYLLLSFYTLIFEVGSYSLFTDKLGGF